MNFLIMSIKNSLKGNAMQFFSFVLYKSILVSHIFTYMFDIRLKARMKEEKFKSINLEYFKSLKCILSTRTNYNILFKLYEIYMYLYAQST